MLLAWKNINKKSITNRYQRMKTSLFFVLFGILLSVASLRVFSPQQVFASAGQIGTHTSTDQTSFQKGVISLIEANKPPQNYPITVMVNMYNSQGEFKELVDALNTGSFAINIRITHITTSTTPQQVKDFAAILNSATWNQGKKPIVVFGNELNAYDGSEWGSSIPASLQVAGETYKPLLQALAESIDPVKYDLAGVALDPYHKYSAASFIDYAKSAFSQSKVTSFATNVYKGVTGANGLIEDFKPGLDLYDHLAGFSPKSRKVFTEFGLDPKIRDIKQQLAFYRQYETEPLPGGFEYATALLPNLCSKSSSGTLWYFYIVGKIYDNNLQEVDDNCQAQPQDGGTFVYPGPVDIYYTAPGDMHEKTSKLAAALANDYLLTCSPQIQFRAALTPPNPQVLLPNDKGIYSMTDLVNHCDTNGKDPVCIFNVGDQTVSVVADQASIPLIRSPYAGRTGSFEGFFSTDLNGINALSQSTLNEAAAAGQSLLLYAPSAKLLPRQAACEKNVQFVKAIDITCDKIPLDQQGRLIPHQGPVQLDYYRKLNKPFNSCALNTKVDNVELRQIFKDIQDEGFVGKEESYCSSEAFRNPISGTQANLADLIMKVQPITPNAYRIGYIMIYLSARPKTDYGDDEKTRIYHLINEPNYMKNIFKVIPVLIPTNFGAQQTDEVLDAYGTPIEGAGFDGAFKRTITPMINRQMLDEVAKKAVEDKKQLNAYMLEMSKTRPQDTGIVSLPYCSPFDYKKSGLSEIDADMNCFFADYINANIELAKGTVLEHTNQLAPCRFYEEATGGETAETLNSLIKPPWDPHLNTTLDGKPELQIKGQINANNAGQSQLPEDDAKMRVFLAVPVADFGLIKDYEQYLFQALVGRDIFDQIQTKTKGKGFEPANGYLRMIGVDVKPEGGYSKTFLTKIDDETGKPLLIPETLEVQANFNTQGAANPVLWGGWLSKFVYSYTANVMSTTNEKPYSPFDLATRKLEPYWLNQSQAVPPTTGPILSCMHLWVTPAEAQDHAQYLLDHLPGQKTLWANYFSGYRADPVRTCTDGVNPDPAEYGPDAIQYLFETIPECNNEPCYKYIIEKTLAQPVAGGQVIDPYIAISIALNENGGLKTGRIDRKSQHFGVRTPISGHVKECNDDNEYLGTIDEKLPIMLNTLSNTTRATPEIPNPDVAELHSYGYQDGGSAMIRLTNLLSNATYTPYCGN